MMVDQQSVHAPDEADVKNKLSVMPAWAIWGVASAPSRRRWGVFEYLDEVEKV